MSTYKVLAVLWLLSSAAAPLPAAAAIGEIFYTEGRVQVKRNAVQKDVGKGYALEVGDVILTGASSQVRMRLKDDSYIALPDNSTFKIDEFSVSQSGRKRKPSSAIFSLLRGGLRTVSGLVGSWSKDTYKVNTPVVTMGIRGTEYSVIYCKNDCPPEAPNGGYVEVLSGAVNAANKEGSVDLEQGQWGEVHSPPKKVLKRPMAFVLHKSSVFDPSKSITVAPGSAVEAGVNVDVNESLRIEGEIEIVTEPPPSPSEPAP